MRRTMDEQVDYIVRPRRSRMGLDDLSEDENNPYVEPAEPTMRERVRESAADLRQDSSTRNILGRSTGAEDRVNQLRERRESQQRRNNNAQEQEDVPSEDIDNAPDESDNTSEGVDDIDGQEADNHEHRHGRGVNTGETLSNIGFFPRLILIGVVAIIIFTIGKYAFDSIFVYDKEKTEVDFTENFDKLMGQVVGDTENYVDDLVDPIVDNISNGVLEYDMTVDYTYNKKGKTVDFVIKNYDISLLADNYSEYKFKKKGKLKVSVKTDVDGNLLDYHIKEVLE